MDLRAALKGQYHAATTMLRAAIERCPEELWTGGDDPNEVWQIAYHALFFTHLYLMPNEEAFRPWKESKAEYQFLGSVPWPPHRKPKIEKPYTKSQVLEYWQLVDGMIDAGVDRLDLDAAECGFPWYKIPKLDHQIMNIRHTQHHAAQVAYRVHLAGAETVDWIGKA